MVLVPLQGGPLGPLLFGLLSLLALVAAVYWTYTDAKTNSDQPAWLWALVVLVAPLLGILLYVLLGRD